MLPVHTTNQHDVVCHLKNITIVCRCSCYKYIGTTALYLWLLLGQVFGNKEVQDSWRQLALEVIVALAENAPAMVRKFGGKLLPVMGTTSVRLFESYMYETRVLCRFQLQTYSHNFSIFRQCLQCIPRIVCRSVPQILHMMVELEDDDEWVTGDDADDEDADSNSIAGESGLDRLACALGGKAILPHILSNVPTMLQVATSTGSEVLTLYVYLGSYTHVTFKHFIYTPAVSTSALISGHR